MTTSLSELPPLPHWEPCNPGCDPEFNGHRSLYCAKLCHNARDALRGTDGVGGNDGR